MAVSAPSARATRTCSRAVPEAIWHFHDSHAAQDGISQSAQPLRASKSAISSRNWQVAAVRCPASSQIRASSRSIGISGGQAGPPGVVATGGLDVVATLMYSILWMESDIPPNARFRGNALALAACHPRVITPGWHSSHVLEGLAFEFFPGGPRVAPRLPGDHPLEALVERLELAGVVGAVAAVPAGLDGHAAALARVRGCHGCLLRNGCPGGPPCPRGPASRR